MKTKMLFFSLVLIIISAINSGLIGLFDLDLIAAIFGASPLFVRILNILLGAAGAYIGYVTKDILGLVNNTLLK
jgi:uncharacterized membrane protein YuzA (DUF378 family)